MSKKDFEDDGRTIADMSFTEDHPSTFSFMATGRRKKKKQSDLPEQSEHSKEEIKMTKKETRSFVLSSVLAVLTVSAIFLGGAYLFILFCIHIWFK